MPDWDADSPELQRNLRRVVDDLRVLARRRAPLASNVVRAWQAAVLQGLGVPDPAAVGRFRGEAGLEEIEVFIGEHRGVPAAEVAGALARFDRTLLDAIRQLDAAIVPDGELDADQLGAVLDLCAWAHAEWVRIHPFANGNGRTARLLANALALRYGLPMFVRERPRPGGAYAAAGEAAMRGDWEPTVPVFRRLLAETLRGSS